MWKWFRERVWALVVTALSMAYAAVSAILNISGIFTMMDQVEAGSSYWFKFLDWMLTTPAWMFWVTFVLFSLIIVLRDHPAILAVAALVKRKNPAIHICAGMRFAGGRFRQFLSQDCFGDREFAEAAGKWSATLVSLSKQGFKVPKFDPSADTRQALRISLDYIDAVEPLFAEGHIKEAKKKAAELAA